MFLPLLVLLPSQSSPPQLLTRATAGKVGVKSFGVLRVDPVEGALAQGAAPDTSGWREITADKDGWFSGPEFEGGYAHFRYSSPQAKTVLLEAQGASFVTINGEPRVGDVYSAGYVSLPVALKAGVNELWFRVQRGRLRVAMVEPTTPVSLDDRDATFPDRKIGDRSPLWAALVVRNTQDAYQTNLRIEAKTTGGSTIVTPLPAIGPLTVRKVGFRVGNGKTGEIQLRLLSGKRELDRKKITLRLRKPNETRKVTFISEIDGSIQYYALNPAQGPNPDSLILSLHGASVEALGQAEAYAGKKWANLVAATNRRPFGYDWEDWGRIDTLEVLNQAEKTYAHDPSRVFLTGHSMGGHGTWYVGSLYPDRFGAIAPSAGWISSYTYAGARRFLPTDPFGDILRRAGLGGDTAVMVPNLAGIGVYALHGDADDNVPVSEARDMIELLKPFHRDYVLKEIPGQNHWWDLSDEAGADAVDYGPMMEFLSRHARPPMDSVRKVDFITPNPEVSSRCHWASVVSQVKSQDASEIHLQCDPYRRRFSGTTKNVERLRLQTSPLMPGANYDFDIDGQKWSVTIPNQPFLDLLLANGKWSLTTPVNPTTKNPLRAGPFRLAFNHRILFVVGTRGTAEENAWAATKAKFDAETWWYRGNGAVDVVTDMAFDPEKEKDRSIILYGNADTNQAWSRLLGTSPVQVHRDRVDIGSDSIKGTDLACLFLRPRVGSAIASVAVVSGTGIVGARSTHQIPYLQPMVGFPDVLVVGADALKDGLGGIRAAGFFGNDWGLATGDVSLKNR